MWSCRHAPKKVKSGAMDRLPKLPLVKQKTNHTCGAASLLCVLRFYKQRGLKEEELAKEMKADAHRGVASRNLCLVAKRHGLKARRRQGLKLSDIRDELRNSHAVIVDFQAWRSHREQRFPVEKDLGRWALRRGPGHGPQTYLAHGSVAGQDHPSDALKVLGALAHGRVDRLR